MHKEELKVPRSRVAVIIGKSGKDKRSIEKLTHTKISIDSKEGDVIVEGESLDCFLTINIILL